MLSQRLGMQCKNSYSHYSYYDKHTYGDSVNDAQGGERSILPYIVVEAGV